MIVARFQGWVLVLLVEPGLYGVTITTIIVSFTSIILEDWRVVVTATRWGDRATARRAIPTAWRRATLVAARVKALRC